MSTVTWINEKPVDAKRRSLASRLAYGPALIIALGLGSSGVLIAALLLSAIFEF